MLGSDRAMKTNVRLGRGAVSLDVTNDEVKVLANSSGFRIESTTSG